MGIHVHYYKKHEAEFSDHSSYWVRGSFFDGVSLATITPMQQQGGVAPGAIPHSHTIKGENVPAAIDKAVAALDVHFLPNGYLKAVDIVGA